MSFKPCVCGGSNENCRYCFGSGQWSFRSIKSVFSGRWSKGKSKSRVGRRKKRPSVQLASSSSEDVRPATSKISISPVYTKCPQCVCVVRTSKLPGHIKRQHTNRESPQSLTTCPVCSWSIMRGRLNQHMKLTHGKPPPAQVHTKSGVVQTRKKSSGVRRSKLANAVGNLSDKLKRRLLRTTLGGKIRCPECGSLIRVEHFEEHVRVAHHGFLGGPTDSESRLVSDRHEGAKSQRNLDSTRLYAHAYREHGKFGSHPTHDGFDDDSNP